MMAWVGLDVRTTHDMDRGWPTGKFGQPIVGVRAGCGTDFVERQSVSPPALRVRSITMVLTIEPPLGVVVVIWIVVHPDRECCPFTLLALGKGTLERTGTATNS
jgi:hypothetical protein